MRRLFLFCCLALSALAVRAEVIDIDNAQLAQLMKSGVTVIDIRTKPEWEETGILPGSQLLTFFDERGKADPAAWLKTTLGDDGAKSKMSFKLAKGGEDMAAYLASVAQ